MRVWVDLKEKRQVYSHGVRELWPDVPSISLFILDETVYRRIIWQGGGGYLVVHDHPGERWAICIPQPPSLMVKVVVDRAQRVGVKKMAYIGYSDAWFLRGAVHDRMGGRFRAAGNLEPRAFRVRDACVVRGECLQRLRAGWQ